MAKRGQVQSLSSVTGTWNPHEILLLYLCVNHLALRHISYSMAQALHFIFALSVRRVSSRVIFIAPDTSRYPGFNTAF